MPRRRRGRARGAARRTATRRCCDPRLNARQSLDLAFRLAELMRRGRRPSRPTRHRLAIVGTGLIGASVGLAAQAARRRQVAGWDPDAGGARAPRSSAGAVDAPPARSRRRRSTDAELASSSRRRSRRLPAQVAAVLDGARRGRPSPTSARPRRRRRAPRTGSPRFVGGHPICGSEARGAENATRRPLRGRDLVPHAGRRTPTRRGTGSCTASSPSSARRPVAIDADAHDRLVALTSHLPHVLANVARQPGRRRARRRARAARARGRLAARHDPRRRREPAHLGRHLPRQRRRRSATALAEHRRAIEQVEARSSSGTPGFLARWIGEAARQPAPHARARVSPTPARCSGCACTSPTGPACSPAITQALGAERINIEDFELHHMSPERGGTLTRARRRARTRRSAPPTLLESQGYGVVVSAVIDEG